MEHINIKIAFCLECGGYHSATPADQTQINHPEIIDHYFYHGEPWFTLDLKTFKKSAILEKTEVKILSLNQHKKNDHKYCHCKKNVVRATKTKASVFSFSETAMPVIQKYKNDFEADIYFRDVYQLSYNFH